MNPQVPDAASYRNVEVETPLRVLSRDGALLAEFGERRAIPITLDEVPKLFIRALVDTEDKRFYSHQGVDLISLVNDTMDLVLNPSGGRAGASTLTMQLARNVSFSLEQTFIRKFKEMLLALKIERQLSKEEILNLYINLVPFGKRAHGAEAAAQTYYGKSLQELNLAQLAMLAGIPQAPSSGNPINGPERALNRRNVVLSRMRAQNSITDAEYQLAVAEPITAKLHRQGGATAAPYPAELVRQELLPQYPDLYTGGYEVRTTIESPLQQRAISALRNGLHSYDERHGYRGTLGREFLPPLPQLAPVVAAAEALSASAVAAATTAEAAEADPDAAVAAVVRNADPLPEVELDPEVRALVDKALGDYPTGDFTQAAMVLLVGEDTAIIALQDGTVAPLLWPGLSWARPYISVSELGPVPERAADIVEGGSIIRVRATDAGWRLSQIPEIQGALSSLHPTTGAIRALTGGYDFARNQYNHAVQARRQPGSGFKPFVYSAALDAGITPASVFMDAPIVLQDQLLETEYRPDNNNKRYNGPTRLREALYRSINLVSIRVLLEVGAGRVLRHVKRFGFDTSEFPRNTQLGIGGGTMGVNTLAMAKAYGVFANGGYLVEPHLILEVSKDGEILETRRYPEVCEFCLPNDDDPDAATEIDATAQARVVADPLATATDDLLPDNLLGDSTQTEELTPIQPPVYAERVLDADNAYVMHTMLQDVIRRGTGRRAAVLDRIDIAGKTGTTNDAADTWFNGYAGEFATTVWVGFSDYTPLGPWEYGATTALPIWVDFMRLALQDSPQRRFEQPETVVSLKIDPGTGEVARPGQRNAIFEYFLQNNVPEASLDPAAPNYERARDDAEEIDTTDLF